MKVVPAMIVGALFASTAAAQTAPGPEAKEEKKICKTEPILGSRTRVKRTCLTDAEWRQLATRTRDGLNDAIKDGATFTGDSNLTYGPAGMPGH